MPASGLPASVGHVLHEGLAALALPESIAAPLLDYLGLLVRWNHTYNLTAVRAKTERQAG